MTLVKSTEAADLRLSRLGLNLARHYLGNRWVLLAVGVLAIILGLTFGGWGWLVAAGLAPIILSTVPCLVMCGFGICMMCRSGKKESASAPGAVDAATSPSALGIAEANAPPVAGSRCCHEDGRVNPANAPAENAVAERPNEQWRNR